MNINLIYNQKNMQSIWEDILSLIYPNASQSYYTVSEWTELANQEVADLVLYISSNVTDSQKEIMDYYYNLNVPVLFVLEHYTENEFNKLLSKKLKGLIHMDTTSVKSIKEITDLILEGGYYLEPPVKVKL